MKKLFTLLIPLTLFLHCSKDADPEPQDPVPINIEQIDGYVQKGPYIGGTQIQISSLNSDLSQTGINFNTEILNDEGFFSIENIEVESDYLLFSGIGFYFNEVTGALSSSNLSLQTLSNIENRSSLNINILTHLERKRVEYLHTENGLTFIEAKTQAINEIFDIFCMSDVDSIESEDLNILESGENNAKLLAISIILQGNLSVGDLSELLFDISSDIETDGVLDDIPTINYLRDIAASISNVPGLETIRSNIESRMEFLDITDYTIPDFESYIVNFLECNSGAPLISNFLEVSDITATSAKFQTGVLANSAETIITLEYGLTDEYGFSTEALESPINGVNMVEINFEITDLPTNDTGNQYFFRVKAENSNGIVYSEFDVNTFNTLGLLTDIEGNEYNTIKIGEQYWMTSNLKTSTYKNGELVPYWVDIYNDDFLDCIINGWEDCPPGWLYYNNDSNLNEIYGKWYNSSSINSSNGLCPQGWKIPNANDIDILGNFLGTEDSNNPNSQWFNAGALMTVGGNSGFEGYGGGSVIFTDRNWDGAIDYDLDETAYFWISGSSPSDGDPYAYFHFNIGGSGSLSISGSGNDDRGFCVRCIKVDEISACPNEPELITESADNISISSAWLYGEIHNTPIGLDCEIYPVISQGFVYGLNQSPTTEDNTVTTYAINNEHIEITGLEEDTTYYVRTYLTNSLGTFYGNEISFETPLQ